ncbi:MAG TPA: energy transducer TonB [Nitrospirae bacterium]|nr:energy transducer TonB [Nitrospirota bacterium]
MRHYQSIGTGLSFLMHLVFILLLFSATKFTSPEKRIITIDFSINNIKGSVIQDSKDTAKMEKAGQVVKKRMPVKEKRKSGNMKKKVMEKPAEKKPVKSAEPRENIRPPQPEEVKTEEHPPEPEMAREPVDEDLPEPAVQEPESLPSPSDTPMVADEPDTDMVDDMDSTVQSTATSPEDIHEGKTGTEGVNETASALHEETGESLTNRYVKRHFNYIRDMIQGNLSYPLIARRMGWTGRVIVSFIVCKDGRVENIKVVESSGIAILDRNAVETIKKVSPFPKPPVNARLIVPIAYVLR